MKSPIFLSYLFFCVFSTEAFSQQCQAGNCVTGSGRMVYASGVKYEGEFLKGKRHGKGTCHLLNGDKYVGFWQEDYPNGKGVMYKRDGTKTEGIWEKGKLKEVKGGIPAMVKKGADSQNATDKNCLEGNCMDGVGVYKYETGDIYRGDFKHGMRHGKGVYVFITGERYVGDFERHGFQGEGVYYLSASDSIMGIWQQGAYVGPKPAPMEEIVAQKEERVIMPSKSDEKPMVTKEELGQNQVRIASLDTVGLPKDQFEGPLPNMKVWAVVVGVTTYTAMAPLQYTDDDAELLAEFLQSPEGGALPDEQLVLLLNEDATFSNIVWAMSETFEKAGPDDLIVLYFSGHGLEGFFLPTDYDGHNNMLSHGIVNSILLDSKAKYKLCIADACHSGSLLASNMMTRGMSADQKIKKYYNAFKDIRGGVALMMSSMSEEYSLESNGLKQGLFSHFLIKGMAGQADADKNSIVTVSELYDFVQKGVVEYSAGFQNPVMSGNFDKNMPVGIIGE